MDAGFELIKAMMDKLRGNPVLAAYVGDRIFDRVPEDANGLSTAVFPYITLGPTVSIPDDYDCMYGEEITVQWDVWTSGDAEQYGSVACRKISNIVKRTLHDVDLALTNNALITLQWEITRILNDPNPAIGHGVIQFTATLDTPTTGWSVT